MAEALKERSSQEIMDRDLAIEALRAEVDRVEAGNKQLMEEVDGLRLAKKDLEDLRDKMESLSKDLEGAKAVEQLALERARKAIDTAEGLRKEADAERQSSRALGTQVDLLTKRLEEAKAVGLSVAKLFIGVLGEFGGVTSPLLFEPSAYDIFAWMKSNFTKLPGFVGGAVDFGALSSATNLSKILVKSGCMHVEGLKEKKEFESPAELGESS
jgi:hypothetical protein